MCKNLSSRLSITCICTNKKKKKYLYVKCIHVPTLVKNIEHYYYLWEKNVMILCR